MNDIDSAFFTTRGLLQEGKYCISTESTNKICSYSEDGFGVPLDHGSKRLDPKLLFPISDEARKKARIWHVQILMQARSVLVYQVFLNLLPACENISTYASDTETKFNEIFEKLEKLYTHPDKVLQKEVQQLIKTRADYVSENINSKIEKTQKPLSDAVQLLMSTYKDMDDTFAEFRRRFEKDPQVIGEHDLLLLFIASLEGAINIQPRTTLPSGLVEINRGLEILSKRQVETIHGLQMCQGAVVSIHGDLERAIQLLDNLKTGPAMLLKLKKNKLIEEWGHLKLEVGNFNSGTKRQFSELESHTWGEPDSFIDDTMKLISSQPNFEDAFVAHHDRMDSQPPSELKQWNMATILVEEHDEFDPLKAVTDYQYWMPKNTETPEKKFLFSTVETMALMRFVWTGCLLPEDRDSYCRRLAIDKSHIDQLKVWEQIDQLLVTYKQVKHDNVIFNKDYDQMVQVAKDVNNYASTAGGTEKSSYYYKILQWVGEYKDATDPAEKKKLSDAILGGAKDMQGFAATLIAQADKTIKILQDFETKTTKNSQGVTDAKNNLHKLLADEKGVEQELSKDIQDKLKELAAAWKEYERGKGLLIVPSQFRLTPFRLPPKQLIFIDCLIAETSPTYAWCGPIGLIAAITTSAIYGKRAVELKEKCESLKKAIEKEKKLLEAAYTLDADIGRMVHDVENLSSLIAPALHAVQLLRGAWAKISSDLTGISRLIKDDDKVIKQYMLEKLHLAKIAERWEVVDQETALFIENAYVSGLPKDTSIDELIKELEKRSHQDPPPI
ncbi:hypothetical protein FQN57_004892 [Myotisia sp. PD_48]|nr:hypothetical protein FQN57_004892 [Myotisia sp. PD_48]